MAKLFALALLVACIGSAAAQWQTINVWTSSSTCGGSADLIVALASPACAASSCAGATSGGISISEVTACPSTVPSLPTGYAVLTSYNNLTCHGTPTSLTGILANGKCNGYAGSYYLGTCVSNAVNIKVCTDSACQTCSTSLTQAGCNGAGINASCSGAATLVPILGSLVMVAVAAFATMW